MIGQLAGSLDEGACGGITEEDARSGMRLGRVDLKSVWTMGIALEVGGRCSRGTRSRNRAMKWRGRVMANMKGVGRNADVAKRA
jgi:hypothetical protein